MIILLVVRQCLNTYSPSSPQLLFHPCDTGWLVKMPGSVGKMLYFVTPGETSYFCGRPDFCPSPREQVAVPIRHQLPPCAWLCCEAWGQQGLSSVLPPGPAASPRSEMLVWDACAQGQALCSSCLWFQSCQSHTLHKH